MSEESAAGKFFDQIKDKVGDVVADIKQETEEGGKIDAIKDKVVGAFDDVKDKVVGDK